MAEAEGVHRRELQTMAVKAEIASERLGTGLAFTLAVVVFVTSAWLVFEGNSWEGTVLASLDLVALVGLFIYGRSGRDKGDGR